MYGPGVMDMKGGIVLILNLINNMDLELKNKIRAVITEEEETGSNESKDLLKEVCNCIFM